MLNQRNNFANPLPSPFPVYRGRERDGTGIPLRACMPACLRASRPGFTLIEVMIAVALSLMLLYGINRVFSTTGDVIGLGNATMEANTQLRSAATAMRGDFQGADYNPNEILGASPASSGIYSTSYLPLVITNQEVPAWRNKREAADNGNDPVKMPKHRIDTVSFFSHGSFARQTGDQTQFTINATANDAWIWYGHVMLPNNPDDSAGFGSLQQFMQQSFAGASNPNFYPPGQGNNIYAQNWVLGRTATLMYPRLVYTVGATNYHPIYPQMPYVFRSYYSTPPANGDLEPIWINSPVVRSPNNLQESPGVPDAYPSATDQWRIQWALCDFGSLSDSNALQQISAMLGNPAMPWSYTLPNGSTATDWWQGLVYRFNCLPDVVTPAGGGPLLAMPQRIALTNPALIRGCTDFIVDFAGDFNSDGKIDTYDTTYGSATIQQIQWYGLPDAARNVVAPPTGAYSHTGVATLYGNTADVFAWSPKEVAAMGANPAIPQLIRITIKVVDQRDQLQVPMTRQFIFKLR